MTHYNSLLLKLKSQTCLPCISQNKLFLDVPCLPAALARIGISAALALRHIDFDFVHCLQVNRFAE